MISVSPSEAGLFYFPEIVTEEKIASVSGTDELNHLSKVMRKRAGEHIYITDGRGILLQGEIMELSKDKLTLKIISSEMQTNPLERFSILLPILKNPDRLEFALEKCIELGFTHFKIVKYQHSVKSSVSLDRLTLKGIAAMKQSLRTFLPFLEFHSSLESALSGEIIPIYFDQFANNGIFNGFLDAGGSYNLAVGPEGGFSRSELEILKTGECYRLSGGRLRSETAIITAASFLANKLDFQ